MITKRMNGDWLSLVPGSPTRRGSTPHGVAGKSLAIVYSPKRG